MNIESKEYELIALKMNDYIINDTLPLVGDCALLDYVATKGVIDLNAIAAEVGENRWYSWTQYVMDLKQIAKGEEVYGRNN